MTKGKEYALVFGGAALVLLVLLGVVLGWSQLNQARYEIGRGRSVASPSGGYVAHAHTTLNEAYRGGQKRVYYKFDIRDGRGNKLKETTLDAPDAGAVEWSEEGTMEWDGSGSVVTFKAKDVEVVLSVK